MESTTCERGSTRGAGGIRTLDRALQPYNGLANRRLQPLGHISGKADMPDTEASRKRQISGRRVPSDLTPEPGDSSESLKLNCDLRVVDAARIGQRCLQDFLPRPIRLPFRVASLRFDFAGGRGAGHSVPLQRWLI